jgi:hypothetical protein
VTYETLIRIAISLYNAHKDNPEDFKEATGLVAEGLHRTKPIHSGLISEKCASNRSTEKICKEHYFGRLASAKKIMSEIAKGRSFKRLVALARSRSRVHYTTKDENQKLRAYGHLFWREAYKEVGTNLIPYVPRTRAKDIDVNGKVFSSAKEVSKQFNIPIETVRYRIAAKSKKWAHWKHAEKPVYKDESV